LQLIGTAGGDCREFVIRHFDSRAEALCVSSIELGWLAVPAIKDRIRRSNPGCGRGFHVATDAHKRRERLLGVTSRKLLNAS
jgi:hypothetical protein